MSPIASWAGPRWVERFANYLLYIPVVRIMQARMFSAQGERSVQARKPPPPPASLSGRPS